MRKKRILRQDGAPSFRRRGVWGRGEVLKITPVREAGDSGVEVVAIEEVECMHEQVFQGHCQRVASECGRGT